MSRNAEQKIKLLILYEILQKNTDSEHPMTTQAIIKALREYGIEVNRKTIYEDISVLNKYGYEVCCDKSRSNCYYVEERKFERPEIEFLLNAVGAAKFLTEKKTSALTEKIAEMLGLPQSETLKSTVIKCDKRNNEQIYYSIDAITSAILEQKQVSFLYFDYGLKGEKIYRRDKQRYKVNPLGMVYSGDNFYLVCFREKYGEPANYRIDRMDNVIVEDAGIVKLKKFENFDMRSYKKELFSMYTGEKVDVTLSFPTNLLEIVMERFGEDNQPVKTAIAEYTIKVPIQVSKTFFSWLTTFEGQVKIQAPERVREQYRSFLNTLLENF